MAIALRVLAVDEEPLRHDQMKVILRAGHGNVEQATLLLDLGRGAGTEIGRHAAIDGVEQIDRLPLLALRGVDRGQDQVVFVEQRYAGLVAGGVGRIQREFGEEAFARRISGGDLLSWSKSARRVSASSWMRSRCGSYQRRARSRSTGHSECRRLPKVSTKPLQLSPARGGVGMPVSAAIRVGGLRHAVEHALRGCGPHAGQQMQQTEFH